MLVTAYEFDSSTLRSSLIFLGTCTSLCIILIVFFFPKPSPKFKPINKFIFYSLMGLFLFSTWILVNIIYSIPISSNVVTQFNENMNSFSNLLNASDFTSLESQLQIKLKQIISQAANIVNTQTTTNSTGDIYYSSPYWINSLSRIFSSLSNIANNNTILTSYNNFNTILFKQMVVLYKILLYITNQISVLTSSYKLPYLTSGLLNTITKVQSEIQNGTNNIPLLDNGTNVQILTAISQQYNNNNLITTFGPYTFSIQSSQSNMLINQQITKAFQINEFTLYSACMFNTVPINTFLITLNGDTQNNIWTQNRTTPMSYTLNGLNMLTTIGVLTNKEAIIVTSVGSLPQYAYIFRQTNSGAFEFFKWMWDSGSWKLVQKNNSLSQTISTTPILTVDNIQAFYNNQFNFLLVIVNGNIAFKASNIYPCKAYSLTNSVLSLWSEITSVVNNTQTSYEISSTTYSAMIESM